MMRVSIIIPAPWTKARDPPTQELHHVGQSKYIGDSPDEQDHRYRAGVVKHQLQSQYPAFDPIGRQFLDGCLRGYIDEINGNSASKHDQRHQYNQQRIGIPALRLQETSYNRG